MWQWLNSWPPRWPFLYFSAANLLKSFHSPFAPTRSHINSGLIICPSFSVQRDPLLSLTDTHTRSQNPAEFSHSNQSLPIAPFPLPVPDKKRRPLLLPKPPQHPGSSNLDYLPSLFCFKTTAPSRHRCRPVSENRSSQFRLKKKIKTFLNIQMFPRWQFCKITLSYDTCATANYNIISVIKAFSFPCHAHVYIFLVSVIDLSSDGCAKMIPFVHRMNNGQNNAHMYHPITEK